jgi:hypothetical protein
LLNFHRDLSFDNMEGVRGSIPLPPTIDYPKKS